MAKLLSKKNRRLLITALLLLVIALLKQTGVIEPVVQKAEQTQPGTYRVIEFIDGDTIAVDMDGVKETIRMIGVDTPETKDPRKPVQCFGTAASKFTKGLIGHQHIRLEADPINTNRDRYNRLLRYVYLPDQKLVNAEIIEQGYGFAYTSFPFTKIDQFKQYQKEARAAKRGLWSNCPTNPTSMIQTGGPGQLVYQVLVA